MRVCPEPLDSHRGRPALTRYRPLERFGAATLLAVEIPTGVMHQIRVHLMSIGHPIAGDRLYGSPHLDHAAPRQMLHACNVTFLHPETAKPIRVTSPLPSDFTAELESLRRNQPAAEHRPSRSIPKRARRQKMPQG
jgi:23S rRNA pseudouridine1911/1915/1917 synthase